MELLKLKSRKVFLFLALLGFLGTACTEEPEERENVDDDTPETVAPEISEPEPVDEVAESVPEPGNAREVADIAGASQEEREAISPEDDLSVVLAEIEDLYRSGEFFDAWQLAREVNRTHAGAPEADDLGEWLRLLTEARRMVPQLNFALENLSSDDPMVLDVARRELRGAGETGLIVLRQSIGRESLDRLPEIVALLEAAGDADRVGPLLNRLHRESDAAVRSYLAGAVAVALEQGVEGAYERVVAQVRGLPPEEITPVWPALVQSWKAHSESPSELGEFLAEALTAAAHRLSEEQSLPREQVMQAAMLMRDQDVLNRVMEKLGPEGATIAGLPPGWQNTDIGNVGAGGSAFFRGNRFIVKGAGGDIWGGDDEFHFVHREKTGDVSLTVKVHSQENTERYAKSGIMIRQGLEQNDRHGMVVVSPEGRRIAFQYREEENGEMSSTGINDYEFPVWIRLSQVEGEIIAEWSQDSEAWEEIGRQEILMEEPFRMGLVVCSNVRGTLNRTEFEMAIEDWL